MSQSGPSAGLSQRRRGAGAAPSPLAGGAGGSASNTSTPLGSPSLKQRHLQHPAGATSTNAKSGAGAGSIESSGGHRIAYDPRDLNDEDEETRFPRLTLMEETLLLGLKDRQGYLSFWNDSISYALRACIIAELFMRRRLRVVRESSRMSLDVQDRPVEVVSGKMTGEVLLDEALKLIKASEEKRSVGEWIDLLSGETWNLSKIGYQLKQVRERLAKGLVDKGVLRTEKRNFLLFDMATHPVADASAKRETLKRVHGLLCGGSTTGGSLGSTSASLLASLYDADSERVSFPAMRCLLLVACAFAANVLDNALLHLTYESREAVFQKVEDWLEAFGQWPMAPAVGGGIGAGAGGGSFAKSSHASSSRAGGGRHGGGGGGLGGARIAEGSVLPDSDQYGLDGGRAGGGVGGIAGMSNGASAGHGGSMGAGGVYTESNIIGAATQDLVRRIRDSEAEEAGDAMLEGLAGVLAVLGRMDSLL